MLFFVIALALTFLMMLIGQMMMEMMIHVPTVMVYKQIIQQQLIVAGIDFFYFLSGIVQHTFYIATDYKLFIKAKQFTRFSQTA